MNSKQHITLLKRALPNIASILEIQCGGGYEIENCLALQDRNLFYYGVDVRDQIILDNRQYFRHEKNKVFMTLDPSNEPLPRADLIVATGMAPFLPIANIWSLLENIRDSEGKYFAFDYYHSAEGINSDVKIEENSAPQKRGINLCAAPFYFPKPRFLIPTDDLNISVAVYEISAVSYYMDWHNEDVSKLRQQLALRLEQDIRTLEDSFSKQPNGLKLFDEMMVKFLSAPAADHNQKYYYEEPFKTIINAASALQIRNNIFRLVYKSEPEVLAKEKGYEFINSESAIQAQILAKDYIRWRFGLSIWID